MTDGAGSEAWSFDPMGRMAADQRTTNGVTKTTSYTYNPDGTLATLTYPSGRVVTYQTGGAELPLSASDSTNTYAASATYAPQEALATLTLGQSISLNQSYSSRLQPLAIQAKAGATNLLDLAYDFGLGTADNGDVKAIVNNRDNNRTQYFSYDALNRIVLANTQAANEWGQAFRYDPWGNLTSITVTQGSALSLTAPVDSHNRITNAGYSYDASGNLLTDGVNTYTWDAEGRMATVVNSLNGRATYSYDGDGHRVMKASGQPYWYGADGSVLSESDLSGHIRNEYVFFGGKRVARVDAQGNVDYYLGDSLGSARTVIDSNGNILDDCDFLPFGEERCVTSSSGNTYKFTGKERDPESNLDNFGARYFTSNMGRFMSPDPLAGHTEDPQTLNRYVYVRDNPLSLTDPTGLDFYLSCQKASDTCQKDTAGNMVQGQYVTDANNNRTFQATVITSASLQDPNSGNTATVNQNGVQITTASGTAEGIFINNTPAAQVQGSGYLAGFTFNVNSSDEKIGTLDAGTYTYEGSRNQADVLKVLTERGAFQYTAEKTFGNPFHKGDLNFRFSSGAHPELFDYGPSPHLLVPNDPRATVPVGPGYIGPFHVDSHTGDLSHGGCAILHVGCQ